MRHVDGALTQRLGHLQAAHEFKANLKIRTHKCSPCCCRQRYIRANAKCRPCDAFQHGVDHVAGQTVVFADMGFDKKDWHPDHLRLCQRGEWNDRMMIETTLSMLTLVCHFKKVVHRKWPYFQSRVGYTIALFNLLVQWHGLEPDETGFVHLTIAEFSL